MKNGEMTVEVNKTNKIAGELSEIQQAALKTSIDDYKKASSELEKKKYLIDVNKDQIKILKDFARKDAQWKFNECLGIIEINKVLDESEKSGKLFVNSVAVEALYYYLSKVEGKGNYVSNAAAFPSVIEYLAIVKSFVKTREVIKVDQEKLKQLEFVIESRSQGIEPDASLTENLK